MEKNPACPYCQSALDKQPKRKKKCPSCGHFIFVRTLPETREQKLVTESEAREIDGRWDNIQSAAMWFARIEHFGISERDFKKAKMALSSETDGDLNVKAALALIDKKIAEVQDPKRLSMLYHSRASLLDEAGEDFFESLTESAKCSLTNFNTNIHIRKVRILTAGENNACDSCLKMHGRILTMQDAFREMPIPNKNCTTEGAHGKTGFCRCGYIVSVDDEDLERISAVSAKEGTMSGGIDKIERDIHHRGVWAIIFIAIAGLLIAFAWPLVIPFAIIYGLLYRRALKKRRTTHEPRASQGRLEQ